MKLVNYKELLKYSFYASLINVLHHCLILFCSHFVLEILDQLIDMLVLPCYGQDLAFAIIIAKNQLVALVQIKNYYLHPMDLHLIINLVNASESFKIAESWTPICLPKLDARYVF